MTKGIKIMSNRPLIDVLPTYNEWKKKFIKLSPGEEICPKCKGKGCSEWGREFESRYNMECFKCYGKGKIDWKTKLMRP